MMGLYSNGNSNIDTYLKGWSCDPFNQDREKGNKRLNRPCCSFGGMLQPGILANLTNGKNNKLLTSGALARYLFYVPKSNVGTRDMNREAFVSDELQSLFEQQLLTLLEIETPEELRTVQLSKEAMTNWKQFRQRIESRLGAGKDLEPIQEWASKLDVQALRIAGIVHVAEHMENADKVDISGDKMQTVITFCEQAIEHARVAFDIMETSSDGIDTEKALSWIRANTELSPTGDKVFAFRDLQQARFRKASPRCLKALNELKDSSLVDGPFKLMTNGRSKSVWYLNPAV